MTQAPQNQSTLSINSASDGATGAPHGKTLAALRRAAAPLPQDTVLMRITDVARALAVSKITIYRWTRSGLLRSLKLGSGDARSPLRYRATDVAAFIEARLGE